MTVTPDRVLPGRAGAAPQPAPYPGEPGEQSEAVFFDLQNIGTVHAQRLDRPDTTRSVIYHGGSGFALQRAGRRVRALSTSFNADVIAFDYPGEGGTSAPRDVATLTRLGPALYDALTARGWIDPDAPVYAFGFSFGGAMAANLAAERPISGLVLESSAPDIEAVARRQIPLALRPLLRPVVSEDLAAFPYAAAAAQFSGPILLIIAEDDTVVPPAASHVFAQDLMDQGRTVTVVTVPQADHGEAFYARQDAIAAWLEGQ